MTLKNYLEKVCYKDINDLKNKTLADLIAYMYKCDSSTFYVVENKKPIYIFTSTDMLEIFMKNLLSVNIEEFINKNPKQVKKLTIKTNILDAYYFMRSNKLKHIPIVNEEGELLGEISFKTLSLKIADIVIKDPLTGLFNQKYFDVLLEEYNEFNKPLGIIFIELKNMNILEGFYGADKINEIIKTYAEAIKSSVRDIDFVFRNGYIFKILTFNNLEITDKIVKRIKNKLENTEYEGIKVAFEIVFSHVPELEDNVLTAIESCEKKLIERD
ncbi:diguanylate cyclase [Nautilia lithotrophica]